VNRISVRASKIAVALLFLIPFASVCHADESRYDWQRWGAVSDTLRAAGQGGRLELSSSFIVEGSERVFVDGIELERARYEINYQRGLFRIKSPVPAGAEIVVSYTRLPFLLGSVYSLREIEFAPGDSELAPKSVEPIPPDRTTASRAAAGNLVFGGLKSISFTVGSNRSATFDQTLRATVEGNLTPTIRVKALLSDDNLPIQPEGNTQELEYLDKVYVEITGSRAGATLGDIAYENAISDFNSFRRELKGASGSLRVAENTRVEAAGGSSKGVFRSVSFRGSDQLQGPYDLLPAGGLVREVIIAGTEKVYFDGDLLLRGENRDYTIDYDRGTVTFTARRPVSADTEISVDFEFTQEQYDRSSAFGSSVSEDLAGGLKLAVLAAAEWDDADRPKSVTIDENDRETIAAAGDDAAAAVAGGATLVGAGNGDYVVVPADTIAGVPEHFEFDDSAGTHDVVFTDVGTSRGDYLLDGVSLKGIPIFRFVGASGGRYVVGRRLPLPQSHSIYTARLSKEGPGWLGFDLQYNVSDFDANTLSELGDGDNVGDAGEAKLRIQRIPVAVGNLEISGSFSTILDRYRSLEKTRSSYFYRDWNLENEPLSGREILEEIASTFTRADRLKLGYQLGRLDRDDFRGVKHEVRGELNLASDRALTGRAFSSDVTGGSEERTRRHGAVGASYGVWKTVPSVEFATEEYLASSPELPDSGVSYRRYAVRLNNRREGRFGYSLQVEQRDTEELTDTTGGWSPTRTDRTFGGSIASRSSPSLQGEVVYSHRIRDDKVTGDTRSSDLARLNGLVRSERVGLRSTVEYEIGQNRQREQKRSVVFVGDGKGDYNELGEPVGKGRGAYTVVLLPTDETIPTQRVALTWNLSLKAPVSEAEGGIFSWLLANVSLNQSLSVSEETTERDAYKVYLLFPSALQRDGSTLAGVVSLRQDWSLLEAYPGWSLTFRFQRDDEEENRYGGVNEERYFEQETVRLDRSLTDVLSANVELRREVKARGGRGLPPGTGSTYDVLGRAVAAGWGVRLPAGSTFDGELELADQEDAESTARQRAIAIRPRVVWHAAKSLNIFARYEVTRFSLPVDPGVRPIFFSVPGTTHRWSASPNFRLSNVISLLGTYQGRSEKTFSGNRVVEHELTIETRAFF
jgi:hypothetical protein